MQAHRLSLSAACTFAEADFLAVPAGPGWDIVYSVEAFLHAVDPERYFGEAARLLRPGGRLILCDDFLTERSSWSDRERAWLRAYQVGWHVPNLRTAAAVEALARRQGLQLRRSDSLTPYLRLRALPDGLAVLLRSLAGCLPVRHPIRAKYGGEYGVAAVSEDGAGRLPVPCVRAHRR